MKILNFKLLLVAQLALVATVSAQQKIRLTNQWEFLRQDLGSVWEAVRPVPNGAPESVPLWDTVFLPHCVNAIDAVDPDVNYYQGPAWYRSTLKIVNPYQGGRTLLHFEGAGQKTEVYIYTTKVGSHVGGYDEWTIDITEAVEQFQSTEVFRTQFKEQIPISIRTDNSRDTEMIPSSLSDFNIYGGIYRYLNIIYVPVVSFDKVFVKTETDAAGKVGTVKVSATFYNPKAVEKGELIISLLSPEGKTVSKVKNPLTFKSGAQDIAFFEIKKPMLWSPATPRQYKIAIELKTGDKQVKHEELIGFRHFEFVEHGPFKLNGERLLLRGTHRHEDHAGVGAAMTEHMMRTEMIMMKEMGVNFIRLGHYQQSEIILDLCDSLGILVWEEIPWCRGGLGGEIYQLQARRMLTNMIEQHFNHPSIIIWGLGNENDWPGDFPTFDKDKIRTFMKELNELSHALDPSRKTAIRRCDFCKDIVDVYSPSIWAGWYRGVYTEYKSVSEAEMQKVKHFLHVEWGGDSHAGRHSENPDDALGKIIGGKGADERAGDASLFGGPARISKDGDWSESYICNLIDWHLKEQETMPWLTGTAYWPFKDFSTPVRPDNPVPYVNQKGVVERDFGKKESYYVFQSWWTDKPMVHIYGHSWPVRWGTKDELKMLKVYSNCDEAELVLNGKSYGVKKRNSQDFPASGLRWMLPFQEGKNNVKVTARKGKALIEDTISFVYQTQKWEQPEKVIIEKISDKEGAVTLQVKLVDKNGIHCLDAANFVRFKLIGTGKLIDHLGTSDGSNHVQMYNGRAEIKVSTNNGKNIVSAEVKGLPMAFLEL
jgi:beta-galactosidase